MRREQTKAEEILWRSLRDRQLGVKSRRQVPVGAFIADFAGAEAKVAVEVDGPSHAAAGSSHETDEGRARGRREKLALGSRGGRREQLSRPGIASSS